MTDSLPTRAAALPKLLALRDLLDLTALSRATIYRGMNAGDFPLPIRIGGTNRWPLDEITAFIEERKAVRGKGAA